MDLHPPPIFMVGTQRQALATPAPAVVWLADRVGLWVFGTLGVLVKAKRADLIPWCAPNLINRGRSHLPELAERPYTAGLITRQFPKLEPRKEEGKLVTANSASTSFWILRIGHLLARFSSDSIRSRRISLIRDR